MSTARLTSSITKKDPYPLRRDVSASVRLTAVHYMWKDLVGYNLHPAIPVPDDGSIADVASGTALWPISVAASFPDTVQFHAFDISSGQMPPVNSLPRNIKPQAWNMFQAPPEEFAETFDVVHVRLVTTLINDNNPGPLLQNLSKLLKPGGYLQWDEVSTTETVPSPPTSCVLHACWAELNSNSHPPTPLPTTYPNVPDWTEDFGDVLGEHGFEVVHDGKYHEKPSMQLAWTQVNLRTWEECAHNGAFGHTKEQIEELLALAGDDIARGERTLAWKYSRVARKAK